MPAKLDSKLAPPTVPRRPGSEHRWRGHTAANDSSPAIQALEQWRRWTETFTVKAADGTPTTVTITINGANDSAVISSSGTTGSVTEDAGVNGAGNLVANGALSVTDTDLGQAGFQTQTNKAGLYGTFNLAANGAWTYSPTMAKLRSSSWAQVKP